MADVDRCIRYAEAGLCGNVEANARGIVGLPDNLRNKVFRGKNFEEIKAMLIKYSVDIKKIISDQYNIDESKIKLEQESNNNREGADLYCKILDKRLIIEVKFGSFTDKAPGMESIEKIFGSKVFTETLSLEKREIWTNLVIREYPNMEKQFRRMVESLNLAIDELNSQLKEQDFILSKEQQEYLEQLILNNSGDAKSKTEDYLRVEVKNDGSGFKKAIPVRSGVGEWRVEKIKHLDLLDEKSRVNIFVENDKTSVLIKFTLNNKNNKHLKEPEITIESKYMVNSPSWNVWVKSN